MLIFITVTLAAFMERLKARPKIITKINANVMLDLIAYQELDTLIIEDGIHEYSMFLDKMKNFRHHRKCLQTEITVIELLDFMESMIKANIIVKKFKQRSLFNHTKRENLLRLLDDVNSEITENNTDSSEEESCSSSESSTSEHETESAEVNQDRRKNSIKQLITIQWWALEMLF
ncbi:Hypothetical_protein [Hexamita inflata]|uniref:Hypothetical_protein n=1 Tax=Hexamita inflata TaxID=28002 RepID=A0AA86NWU7_9EUKA|nr:Hypothetical protein HINF_LOCUS15295 [Hexamita inflata]